MRDLLILFSEGLIVIGMIVFVVATSVEWFRRDTKPLRIPLIEALDLRPNGRLLAFSDSRFLRTGVVIDGPWISPRQLRRSYGRGGFSVAE